MKTKNLLITLITSSLFLSCSTTQKSNTTKTLNIYGSGVIQKPVLVDLDVKEPKITAIETYETTGTNNDVEALKQNAVAKALKESNADVLVEPKFTIETTGYKSTVTVTGWPATYKNFRSIKSEDVELLKVGLTQKAEVYEPATSTKKRNKGGVFFALAIGIIAIMAVAIAQAGNNK